MKPPSIRRTLLLRCCIGVGALLCLLSGGIYLLVKQSLFRELDESITQTAAILSNQIELENDTITFEWKEGIGANRSLIEDGLFQFWEDHSGNTTRSPGLHFRDLPQFTGIDGQPLLRNILLPGGHRGRALGLRVHPFVLPEEMTLMQQRGRVIDPKSLPYTLVVARDAEPIHHTLERLHWLLASGSFLTIGLGFMLINRVARVTLRPIDELTAQMKDRAEHQLDSALEVPGALPAELVGLAKNFDSLLARVAAIRQRERDFIRHAAHELRTPIAGLRATTDLALSQPRDAAAYAAHLTTCQTAAVELGELVNRLSALARIGQTPSPPALEPVNVGAVLADCLQSFLPPFEKRGLEVKREFSTEALVAYCDLTLLRIIFNNLLDNAASYASPNSEIRIRGDATNGRIEIRLANQAHDLPDNLERLFEPLFRRDASQYDAVAHLGIGLTLSLEAATAMGATLQARKTDDGRIELILALPVR